jgi:glycine hydroxymethyltransferase
MVMCRKEYAASLDACIFPGMQGGPLMHVIAAKAVAFSEASTEEFRDYQKRIVANAAVIAEALLEHGFNLVSGGTDNHLILLDLTSLGMTGAQAQEVLEQAGMTVNKNAVPFDRQPPGISSGIRIGTPAVTTRKMGPNEMRLIGSLIARVLTNPSDEKMIARTRQEVAELCDQFPLYGRNGDGTYR